jgi:predicted AlkP superfamily phosphohydrolase/phosphomutase
MDILAGCVLFATLTVVLTVAFAHRGFRFSPLWGAGWGAFFGSWLLVPAMLNVHHMPPLSWTQWTIVDAGFLATFALLGAALGAVVTLPVAAVALIRGRDFRNPVWAYAAYVALAMPVAYIGLSAFIEWINFARPPSVDASLSIIGPGLMFYVLVAAVVVWLYRHRAVYGWDPYGARLATAILSLTLAAVAITPVVHQATTSTHIDQPALRQERDMGHGHPLLVIGLDGGNWRTLEPLIRRGAVPTFAAIAGSGIRGKIDALWPPYWSTPAWGAIVTGYPQGEIGVYEDLSAAANGFPPFELPLTLNIALNPLFAVEFGLIQAKVIEPMPTPRTKLAREPVWQRLSRAGAKTAVVRFPFTYPASGQADYVISNRIFVDLWDRVGVAPGAQRELVAPAAKAKEWLAGFSDSKDVIDLRSFLSQPDRPKPVDAIEDPIAVLRTVTNIDTVMNGAAQRLLREDPSISVLMLHVTGFDSVCHAFWQYRFPEDFPEQPPAPVDIQELGPVVDRYLMMVDRQLGELIAAFPSPPNVLIVADHGEGRSRSYPLWRGWHDSPGVFLAAGPDVPHDSKWLDVSYYDVTPTIIGLSGFERAADLRGRTLFPPASWKGQ